MSLPLREIEIPGFAVEIKNIFTGPGKEQQV